MVTEADVLRNSSTMGDLSFLCIRAIIDEYRGR